MCRTSCFQCHAPLGISRRKCLEGQWGRVKNHRIVNTCSTEKVYISSGKFIMYNVEHFFLCVATYSLVIIYCIEYVTAILKSIIQCDCSIRVSVYLWLFCPRGGAFVQMPYPAFVTTWMLDISIYSYNVFCVLFTLLPVFLYYIIKKLRRAKQGLGGTKSLIAPHSNMPIHAPAKKVSTKILC